MPDACLSSCANYIFPAGRRKRLGHPRAVGWHGNMAHVLYLQASGQANWSEPALEEARQLARREAAFYRRIGVDGFVCWFAKIAPYDIDDSYSLRVEDMARFGISGVTASEARAGDDESRRQARDDRCAMGAAGCGSARRAERTQSRNFAHGPGRQRRARPGRGAMATAFGSAAARLSTEFPALNGLAARAKQLTALRSVQTGFASQKRTRRPLCACRRTRTALGRKTVHRGRLGFIRAAARPRAALQ